MTYNDNNHSTNNDTSNNIGNTILYWFIIII